VHEDAVVFGQNALELNYEHVYFPNNFRGTLA